MADSPVIRINIDSSEYDAFIEKWGKYREQLADAPAMWREVNTEMQAAEATMAKLAASGSPDQKPDSPRRKADEQARGKNLKAEEKHWAKIEKHVEKTGKGMTELVRSTIGLNTGLAKLGTGIGIAGGFAALYGAVASSADGLASRNMQNRSLNISSGTAKAYGKVFAKFGGSEDQLARFETAKMNPDQWQGLLAAGLTPQEIQSDDAETLAETFMQRGSKRFLDTPEAVRGTMMRQTGMSNFASELDMNLASSYKPEDWLKAHTEFLTQRDKVADDQKDLDAGTDLKTHLGENLDAVAKAFDHAVIELAPVLTLWSDAATKLTVALLGKVPGAVNYVGDVVDNAEKNLDKSGPVGSIKHDADKPFLPSLKGIKNWWNDDAKWGTLNKHGAAGGANGSGANSAPGEDPRHNPGNMRPPGDGNHFQTFTSDAEGVRAADRQLQIYNDRDHLDTIDAIVHKWAPASDRNDPDGYAAIVAQRAGFKVGEHLNMQDASVRARVESAMFQVESNRHRDLTPERVQAMYDLNFTDAPKPKAAPGDDSASAVKSASGEAQDMHIYAENDPALAAHAETGRVLKKIASQKIDPQIIQIDDDGRDKPMPPILQRPPGMGQFPANQNINVKVSAPAGSSVAVTSSSFPG